ncbi:MAG: hypothetical protein ACXVYU_15535 [Oryzihumus sp.]
MAYQFDTRLSTIAFLTQMDKAMTTFGWINGMHHWKMGADAYASSSPANGC